MEHYQMEIQFTEQEDDDVKRTVLHDGIMEICIKEAVQKKKVSIVLDYIMMGTVLILTWIIVVVLSAVSDYFRVDDIGYGSMPDFFAVFGVLNILSLIPPIKRAFARVFHFRGSQIDYWFDLIFEIFAAFIINGVLNKIGINIRCENTISSICLLVNIFQNKRTG